MEVTLWQPVRTRTVKVGQIWTELFILKEETQETGGEGVLETRFNSLPNPGTTWDHGESLGPKFSDIIHKGEP